MGEVDVLDAIGIFQMPLAYFLWTRIMMFPSLIIFAWYLLKMEIQF